jgi:hypothetical protein
MREAPPELLNRFPGTERQWRVRPFDVQLFSITVPATDVAVPLYLRWLHQARIISNEIKRQGRVVDLISWY